MQANAPASVGVLSNACCRARTEAICASMAGRMRSSTNVEKAARSSSLQAPAIARQSASRVPVSTASRPGGLRAADADSPRRKSEALPDHAALRDVVPGELAPEISESSSSTFRHGDGDHLSQQADNTVQVVQLVARKEPA
jgi:hypothetical protein